MRNHGNDVISRSIPIVASAYARKFGIDISIGGDEAFTDGSRIQLPAIPEDYPYKDALWGFLAHEASHVRYTDFGVDSPNEYHHGLVNSLEDGRIELAFIQEYPGARQTLDEALRLFVHQDKMQKPNASEHPAEILSAYVLYWVRSQWRGQSILDDHYAAAANAMLTVFPADLVGKLDGILAEAPGLNNTNDVKKMVDRILKLFQDESQEESSSDETDQSSDDSGEQEGSEQGDQDDSQGNGSTGSQSSGDESSDTENGESGSSQGDGDSGNSQEQKGQSGSSGGSGQDGNGDDSKGNEGQASSGSNASGADGNPSGGQPSNTSGPGDASKAENVKLVRSGSAEHAAKDIFGEIKSDLSKAARENPTASARVMLPPEAIPMGSVSPAHAEVLEHQSRSTTVSLRKQLMGLVQANDKVKQRYEDRGRKVATHRLSGVGGGDYRIFRREKRKKKVNTAVHILMDASGSMGMNGNPAINIANESALAIAQSLEAIPRVSVAVSAFRGHPTAPVYELLKHSQSARANAGRFVVGASGGTPLATALWHAARDLCNRREERKIVLIVTDGAPAMRDETLKVLDLMKRSGYEVVGIGIGSSAIAGYVEDHCVINEAQELKTRLFDIFRRKLVA